jgi:murein DD-endopeptidase MepM/ murein hydrolase activator NlpD
VQLFGYDLGVVGRENSSQPYSFLQPGGSFGNNEDYRIWGKPIYAMANGTVVEFADDKPTNPNPPDDLSPPVPVEGNHFYIQHGDELMLYAHFQKGTLNPDLLSKGAEVEAGQRLGLAGNSGNSTAPHLHIHAIAATSPWNGPLRPIPFRDIRVLDQSEATVTGPGAEWVDVVRRGLPSVTSLIHPVSKTGRNPWDWRAVDPLSLILAYKVYVALTLPDPPPEEILRARIQERVEAMTPAERRHALGEARKLRTYADALEKELRGGR